VSRALAEAESALGDNGRVVLRYFGYGAASPGMVEAEHDADVQRYSQSLAEALRESNRSLTAQSGCWNRRVTSM